jgi:hypothetical protein
MQGEGKGATLSPQSRPAGSPRNPRVPSRATTSAFPDPPPRAARRLLPAGFPETPTTSTLSAASKLSPPKLSFPPSLCPLFFSFFFLLRLGGDDDDGGRGLNRCGRTDRLVASPLKPSGRRRASERFEVRAAAMMRRERDSQPGIGAGHTPQSNSQSLEHC